MFIFVDDHFHTYHDTLSLLVVAGDRVSVEHHGSRFFNLFMGDSIGAR